jgi:hypothetical protein
MVDFAGSAIIANNLEPFVVHVENQILALHGCKNSWIWTTNVIDTMTAKPIRPISQLYLLNQEEKNEGRIEGHT